jgi:sortase A
MVKYYKKTGNKISKKKILRLISLSIILTGIGIALYVFFPVLSWQLYFAPVFASQEISAPIPKSTIVSKDTIASLISQASLAASGVDFNNAQNWFPNYRYTVKQNSKVATYTISIPKINIENAIVSTTDTDLASHLVNYGGTAVIPEKGNAVVFGHSTLPQLYNPKNYKTAFTFLYKLEVGDVIITNVNGKTYNYKIESISVVDPTNTAVLEQSFDDSYLTLITCTPPGTIWKRLVLKARQEKN